MDIQNEHISLLTTLLPQYKLLNSLYLQIIDSSTLRFESQCKITDFYNEFKDKETFEKTILELLIFVEKEKLAPVISSLRAEIGKNIETYVENKDLFDRINTSKICTDRHNPLRVEIEGQLKDSNNLWQELTQVRNSLESASWNNDKVGIQQLTRKEEQIEELYKKEQRKLTELYQRQKESDCNASQYIHNVFSDICDLSNIVISLLDKYFPVEKEKKPIEAKPVLKQGNYFDMKLVSLIHNECNNIQFENLSETDLYMILNLQPTNAKLTVKSGERTRMCYLIYKLYEYLKTDNRKEWRTTILKVADIDEKYYSSKYKEPESEIPSRKSESFAQRISKIFEYIS